MNMQDGALVCQTCTGQACSTPVLRPCPSGMCVTASVQGQIYKACAPSSLCPATGSQTFSVNLDFLSALTSAACCNTDNCNSANLPSPAAASANSLLCFNCNPITSQCNSSIQCKGTEDRCFQASVTIGSNTIPAFGCASENMCAVASSLGTIPFLQSAVKISGLACCGTNLCNTLTATTTTVQTTTTAPTTASAATTATTTTAPTTPTAPTTTTAATTTAAPTKTISTSAAAITTASDACCIRLGMIHLLIGLLVFTVY
ncbi:threonine-rich protein isoform X2 [Pleuronectes platessa]|uniref:threonine-rich protein isoform X2 n=1 Tax=Pleuronectes platessa TaxID=8262 RepID=UPI00232A322C|nr:threonine-rich protein isoform X2 [Pleuronectes platessa]